MKTIQILLTISLPDDVAVDGPTVTAVNAPDEDPVETYWAALGVSSRKLFRQAALIETTSGPGYTFDDIAQKLSVDYDSVQAFQRNAARTAKAWSASRGTEPPLQFEYLDYKPVDDGTGAQRSILRLPAGLADRILDLPFPSS